ncbi:NAP1-related protein 2-like [Olea europaea var. sylvestris]|uniref:NAP1-related protein 2-like n=1 Tax=Olea europaea var. sylvestris TaxID=158386 RepID=UPI000C1D2D45|nr:NAP1-related protein 2-like [Olea europaea var. sylvestris]
MGVDKGKKQKLEENNATEHIDSDLLLSIEKLQQAQDELEKMNEEASEKVLEIEQKYSEKRKPVYDKRNDIVKSIPDFWMTAFLSHPALSELLTEEDQKIFKYLSSLEVEESKDLKSGCSITFNFKPNPYFEDSKLTKTFIFLEDGTTKISSKSIKWKEGMAMPNGVDETKGNKRSHSEESCFTWFSDTQHKDDIVEIHDEVAEIIKNDLWPNPFTYFNNEADEEYFDVDDGDDEKNGSDSSEENGEDDEVEDGDE